MEEKIIKSKNNIPRKHSNLRAYQISYFTEQSYLLEPEWDEIKSNDIKEIIYY